MDIDLGMLRLMEREREIPFEELVGIIEQAILIAYLKHTDQGPEVGARVELDRKTGHITVYVPELDEDGQVVGEAIDNPTRVKVVLDQSGDALYFSRSRIPALRNSETPPRYWQHVGLYAYRREFLAEYVRLEPTPAERAEALEQLRALENGHRIRCAIIENWASAPVDVPSDVVRVEARLRELGRS